MNIGQNAETYITLFALSISTIGSYYIIRFNWKRYGLLFIASGIIGNILCYIFVKLEFYSYPFRLFPKLSIMPFETVLTVFPFYVLLGVRYSPKEWPWKIPFYWVLVHTGMLFETLVLNFTQLIQYDFKWDFWDSYTWWWIFLIGFEIVGGIIIPEESRSPIDSEIFRFGRIGWFILHFIFIITIFLGGFYLGKFYK